MELRGRTRRAVWRAEAERPGGPAGSAAPRQERRDAEDAEQRRLRPAAGAGGTRQGGRPARPGRHRPPGWLQRSDGASAVDRISVHRHRHADPREGLRAGHDVNRGEDHSCWPDAARRELRHAAGPVEPHRSQETHETMNIQRTGRTRSRRALARTALAAALFAAVAAAGCGDDSNPNSPTPRGEYSQTDVRVGTGAEAVNGKRLSVNYTGWLYNPSATEGKGQQ